MGDPHLALDLQVFEPHRGETVVCAAQRTIWRWHRDKAELLGIRADPDAPRASELEGRKGFAG